MTSEDIKHQFIIKEKIIVQELCESRGGRPGLSVLTSLLVSVDVKIYCTVLRHWSQLVPNMMTSEDIKHQFIIIIIIKEKIIVQELCESRGGRPGLSVLTSLLVSVDVRNY